MKNTMFLASILLFSIFISGCTQQKVTCNPPYILVGNSCCLDTNNNKICDKDETTTPSTILSTILSTTPVITTTISPRIGALDISNKFFSACTSSNNDQWCKIENQDFTNYITINTSSISAQYNDVAEIGVWLSNKGTSKIKNVSYSISCDQTSPTFLANVITAYGSKYKTVTVNPYFQCVGCHLLCDCTPSRFSQKINNLDLSDELSFRIEFSGIKNFPESSDVDCKLKIYSDEPKTEYNFDLIIHFAV